MRHDKTTKLLAVAFALPRLPGAASAEDKVDQLSSPAATRCSRCTRNTSRSGKPRTPASRSQAEVVGWDQCQDKATTLAAAGTPVGLAYVGSRTLKQFASERPDRADADDR
jgi:multiple sugar transport system substrate-binding protein